MSPANRNRPARQRRPAPGSENAAPAAAPQPAVPVYKTHEPAQDIERIGDILRRRRQQRGDDLQQIADYLCIRKSFLVALENNSYDELPADAYVIGFLRSYAAYLGFDGGDAINRYRGEMSGRRRKPALVLPTPIAEGRTPSAFIMIGAAVVALLIYILWYGLSTSDRAAVNAEPTLPPVPGTASMEPAKVAPAVVPVPTPAPTAAPVPAIVPGGIALSSPPPGETGSSGAAVPNQATLAPANAHKAVPMPGLAIPASPPPTPNNIQPAVAEAPVTPPAANEPPVDSRLSIRAEKESWVVIADSKGKTVLDKVMKPGDTFPIPDTPGLKLTTGNSGGIVLVLDGKDLPKLSHNSSILHDIPLDPDRLGKQAKPAKPAKTKAPEDE